MVQGFVLAALESPSPVKIERVRQREREREREREDLLSSKVERLRARVPLPARSVSGANPLNRLRALQKQVTRPDRWREGKRERGRERAR